MFEVIKVHYVKKKKKIIIIKLSTECEETSVLTLCAVQRSGDLLFRFLGMKKTINNNHRSVSLRLVMCCLLVLEYESNRGAFLKYSHFKSQPDIFNRNVATELWTSRSS